MSKTLMLKKYLLSIRKELAFFLLVHLIYFLVAFSNKLPLLYFFYSLLLALVLGFAYTFFGYRRFRESWLAIETGKPREDYDPLLQKSLERQQELQKQLDKEKMTVFNRMADLEKLYTLWMHQIKTPLAAISLLLDKGGSEEEIKGQLLEIEKELNLFLAYLKENLETSDYVFEEVDLDPIIREMIRKYAPIFISKGIQCRYEGSAERLISDKKWLSFILDQLISNALKYTEEGFIQIETKTGEIRVRDSGAGIPPEDLHRIFDMGYTGKNGRRFPRSTGIGLALVQSISQKLNMQVAVESTVDVGSSFILTYPAKLSRPNSPADEGSDRPQLTEF